MSNSLDPNQAQRSVCRQTASIETVRSGSALFAIQLSSPQSQQLIEKRKVFEILEHFTVHINIQIC